jgi:COMM domain containing 9
MPLTSIEWKALGALSKARDKKVLVTILTTVHDSEGLKRMEMQHLNAVAKQLGLTSRESVESLIAGLYKLERHCVYANLVDEQILKVFPTDFHGQLAKLLGALLVRLVSTWRPDALRSQISLPRLNSIDWRIDIKSASERAPAMSVPAVLVQLDVDSRVVNFELTQEALSAMLDGLSKIRDQLGSIASASKQSSDNDDSLAAAQSSSTSGE